MSEKPIIFRPEMVKAILNTKPFTWPAMPIDKDKPFKRMTRRVITPQPDDDGVNGVTIEGFQTALYQAEKYYINTEEGESLEVKPRYEKDDILWVREKHHIGKSGAVVFPGDGILIDKWRPSIHMPRGAARLFLKVTSVRAERLQDITDSDAVSEGIYKIRYNHSSFSGWYYCDPATTKYPNCSLASKPRQAFMWLWDQINGKRGYSYSWIANPWVWVYEFMRIK